MNVCLYLQSSQADSQDRIQQYLSSVDIKIEGFFTDLNEVAHQKYQASGATKYPAIIFATDKLFELLAEGDQVLNLSNEQILLIKEKIIIKKDTPLPIIDFDIQADDTDWEREIMIITKAIDLIKKLSQDKDLNLTAEQATILRNKILKSNYITSELNLSNSQKEVIKEEFISMINNSPELNFSDEELSSLPGDLDELLT